MIFTIDNLDYTGALDAERPPRVWRRLNQPTELQVHLYAANVEFIVPSCGAHITLARMNGDFAFTGYLTEAPEHEYLGWGESGPAYRYKLRALSDESLLSTKLLPKRGDFVQRAAGDVFKTLAEDAAPGVFDTSACEAVATLPVYTADPRKTFREHAAELALRARAAYRAENGKLFFRPIGAVEHTLDASAPTFSPDGLKLAPVNALVNDATVVGAVEPAAFVKDYFNGDGYSLGFYLSETPFLRPGTVILEEEFSGSSLRPQFWSVTDPAGAVAVSQGKLRVDGGTALGTALLRSVEKIELGGGLSLDHGEFEITGEADALVGGLYAGNFEMSGCVAGFRLTPSPEATTQIAAVVNGAVSGQSITIAAGRRYALTTRIYAGEVYRNAQAYQSAQGEFGGGAVAAGARFLLQVHEIDPNDPASQVAPATVLYQGWLTDVPACCDYALINSAGMHGAVSFTRLARVADVEVRTCKLYGGWQNRLVGAMSEGAECRVGLSDLYFYPASAPEAAEKIVVSYRAAARAIARVIDEDATAAQSSVDDDGHRCALVSVASPRPRTFAECESAAVALLRNASSAGWTGEYETWSEFLAGDVFPGDALTVRDPSRAADFTAIVREVEVEASGLFDDRSRYVVRFATESASPLAMRTSPAPELRMPEVVSTIATVGTGYLAAAAEAEIIDIGSNSVMVDAGMDPPLNGGFEVRRSDTGWGLENDRNLAGRFNYRVFTVPRTSRSQTWCLRPYDAQGKYSRVSTILHVDCPL